MELSGLSKICKGCAFVEKCKNDPTKAPVCLGKNEQLHAYTSQSAAMSAAAPLLRETREIRVQGKSITVYKDEIEKELYKHLSAHLGVGLMQNGG